jgi:hypothetical protein
MPHRRPRVLALIPRRVFELTEGQAKAPVLVVLGDIAGVVRDIDLGQASLPTPCTEFDVAALQRHLAKATGRPWQPDAAVCEQALAALAPVVQAEYRGEGMPFGPEVAVADDASPLDRFIAFTGRSPEWTSDRA